MSFTPGATNSPATATDGIVGKGQLANNETITVTRILTNADRRVQVLTPSGSAQIVQLPTTSIVAGEAWDILCASGAAFALTVQSSNGTTLSTLNPGESLRYVTKIATPVASTDWSILSPSLSLADGSVTTPAVRFTGSSADTGIYSPGVDQIAFSNGGVQSLLVSAAGAHTVGNPSNAAFPGNNIVGRKDGSTVAAGMVGELKESNQATLTNLTTTATWQDATSLSLMTPGIWMISTRVSFFRNSATATTISVGISTSSGSSFADISYPKTVVEGVAPATNSAEAVLDINPVVVNISNTTSYYTKVYGAFTAGNPQFRSYMLAIRIA